MASVVVKEVSTLLRSINHLEKADSGRARVDGELIGYRQAGNRLHELSERQILRQRAGIGFVFQNFNLFPHLTALENIAEAPISAQGRPRAQVYERARELLTRVGLGDRAGAYPHQLSGGQQQRVAIARALADIAGKKVSVSSGTNQEKILVEWAEEVKRAGLPEVEIKYYQTNQAVYLALGSGQIDVHLGPSPSAAYHVATTGQTEIVGTYSGAGKDLQGLIALTTKKDNGLVKAYAAALDKLIASGDYAKILERWNLTNEAVAKAEINPPGLPIEGK